ncbi:hypothetical protein CSKR_103355 [Clonorchis sinensis]|uniref:Uncharacterized protein n=1 Tax=Clonorchis sinensis TaxID=79923 RepID=A0A419PGN6_CLOSI|nr:hypothetical protein CSKR_103355 [Clonorchis sinensis]
MFFSGSPASILPEAVTFLIFLAGARLLKWLEREFTARKVRGSIPTSASRLPLSRLGQPGSIPALVLTEFLVKVDEICTNSLMIKLHTESMRNVVKEITFLLTQITT